MSDADDNAMVGKLAAPFLPSGTLVIEEIGDGNLNMVFRVWSGDNSVIVKVAPPYLRVAGDGWPLTQDRIRIEAEALRIHGDLAPGQVPRLLHCDKEQAAMVLEDLRSHTVWRTALIEGRHVAGVAGRVGRYCARTLVGSSDLVMNPIERKSMSARFLNIEMCAITEELVFTAPYIQADSNRYDSAAAELAASLQADLPMRRAAAQLRWEFRSRREAMIHGDLHTGSIMVSDGRVSDSRASENTVSDNDMRAIDLEFAFFGPMAYDTGNVLANLAFASIAHQEQGNDAFARQITEYAREFWDGLCEETRLIWPAREPWNEIFVSDLLRDSARYAATELVRRIVGLAHVADIDSLADGPRLRAQRRAISGARSLALGPQVRSLNDLWNRATNEEILE